MDLPVGVAVGECDLRQLDRPCPHRLGGEQADRAVLDVADGTDEPEVGEERVREELCHELIPVQGRLVLLVGPFHERGLGVLALALGRERRQFEECVTIATASALQKLLGASFGEFLQSSLEPVLLVDLQAVEEAVSVRDEHLVLLLLVDLLAKRFERGTAELLLLSIRLVESRDVSAGLCLPFDELDRFGEALVARGWVSQFSERARVAVGLLRLLDPGVVRRVQLLLGDACPMTAAQDTHGEYRRCDDTEYRHDPFDVHFLVSFRFWAERKLVILYHNK